MPDDYDTTCHTAQEILTLLGFEHQTLPTGDVKVVGFDNKTGAEENFFQAIGDLLPPATMSWTSECHDQWKWVFNGQKMAVV